MTKGIPCPEVLCLDKNRDVTLGFIETVRESISASDPDKSHESWVWMNEPKPKSNKMKQISTYRDFRNIAEMSTSMGVVLASEYDRNATLIGQIPPPINLEEWQQPVFEKLFQMGYFEIIGLTEQLESRVVTEGNRKTMRLISGTNAAELEETSDSLNELVVFLGDGTDDISEKMLLLRNALSEAMINVSKHAYPDDHKWMRTPVNKWWVTATADRDNNSFTIVIYDQGASIPVTFAKKIWSDSVKDVLKNFLTDDQDFEYGDDGAYIRAAMEPGKSQTNQKHRGLGLPEMKSLIDFAGAGKLSLFSRGGICTYDIETGFKHVSTEWSIGGTLIEWTLYLPQV